MSGSNAVPIRFFPKNSISSGNETPPSLQENSCKGVSDEIGEAVGAVLSERRKNRDLPEFRESLRQETALSAMEKVRSAAERLGIPLESALNEYVLFLKDRFVNGGDETVPKNLWTSLRDLPEFETAAVSYCRENTPKIFSNRHNRPLYDEIEFGLFLLGGNEFLDIVNDVEKGAMKEINAIFNERLIRIAKDLRPVRFESGESGVRLIDEREIHERLERNVAAFEQLCELANKIAALKSINTTGKEGALALSQTIVGYLETVERHLTEAGYVSEILGRFDFIKGKLIGNYSSLEYFDGKSVLEIETTANRICESIHRGFALQKRSGFWGVAGRREIAQAVTDGNEAFVRLVEIQKIAEISWMNEGLRKYKEHWMWALHRLYAKAVGFPEEGEISSSDIVADFMTRDDYDEFQIETVHHLVLFSEFPPGVLTALARHLFSNGRQGNVYHEKFKIKLFSIVLRKLTEYGWNERYSEVTEGIKAYAIENERSSGLIADFSQLYLDLAVYYSGFADRMRETEAMECFLRFSRVNQKDVRFEQRTNEFYRRIGGKPYLDRFEEVQSLRSERDIYGKVLSVFADSAQGRREIIDRKAHAVIEELFHNVCHAEIRKCRAQSPCSECVHGERCDPGIDIRRVRRGHTFLSVPIGSGYYLLLQYPSSLEGVFLRLLERRMAFIKTNLSGLLTIGMKNRELVKANKDLDREIRTDRLTGLPNKWQFEQDSEGFESLQNVAAILVNIDNLSDVNVLYDVEKVGDAFVLDVVDKIFRSFFHTKTWKTYRVRSDQFVIVGTDFTAIRNAGTTIDDVVSNLQAFAESYCFGSDEHDGIRVRAQMSVSYCEWQRTEIGKKLQLAIRNGKEAGRTVTRFDPDTYQRNTRRLSENLEGGIAVTEAIMEKRIVPHHQAIVDNGSGQVVKYESLARMRSQDGTVGKGTSFVKHAGQMNLLPLLSREILEGACADFQNTDGHFSVNLSHQDLLAPDFVETFKAILQRFGIRSERVTIEILEETLTSNWTEYAKRILELKTFGCKIALDDFGAEGSNYSRFLWAGWWPDIIKIDGAFIQGLDTDPDRKKIVRAMVKSAEELGCEVVAEHVDTEQVWRIVREMGIRYSQGYFFHEPEPMPKGGMLPTKFELPA